MKQSFGKYMYKNLNEYFGEIQALFLWMRDSIKLQLETILQNC